MALPESIGNIEILRYFSVSLNELLTLPASLGGLTSFKVLRISGNDHLTALPAILAGLAQLEEFYYDELCVTGIPPELTEWMRVMAERTRDADRDSSEIWDEDISM